MRKIPKNLEKVWFFVVDKNVYLWGF